MKILFLFLASLVILQATAQTNDPLYEGASAFKYGFARVEKGNHSFYIDGNNQLAFDTIIEIYHPIDSVKSLGDGFENLTKDKNHVELIVEKNHKKGLIDDEGHWVLMPIFDTLQIKWNNYLQLKIGDKMTYANTWGKELLPLKYEEVGIMDGNYFDVKLNGSWGVYSVADNKVVIPFDYQEFDYCGGCGMNSNYVFAEKNNKWGVIDFKNKALVPFNYNHSHWRMRSDDWVTCFEKGDSNVVINIPLKKEYVAPEYSDMEIIDNLLKAKKNGKYGLIDEEGKTIVAFKYDDISDPYDDFHSGPYLFVTNNKESAMIDTSGKVIVPFGHYDFIGVKNNYFTLFNKKKVGLADSSGKILLPIVYDYIDELSFYKRNKKTVTAFKLGKNGQYGFFLPANKKLVAPKYTEINGLGVGSEDDKENILLEGENKNKKELFDSNGNGIYAGIFDESYFLSDNLLQLDSVYLSGLYNIRQKKMILPIHFIEMDASKFDKGLLVLDKHPEKKEAKYALYDTSGKDLLPFTNKVIKPLDSLYYVLIADNYIEIWNRHTSKITRLRYTKISSPNKFGVCILSDSLRDYLFNFHTNTFLDSAVYQEVKVMKNGCFQVIKAQKDNTLLYGYANAEGKIIVPIEYEYPMYNFDLNFTNTDFLPLSKYDKAMGKYLQGLAKLNGKVAVAPIYNLVIPESTGKGFLVKKGEAFGILNQQGEIILKPAYQNIILDEEGIDFHSSEVKFSFPILCRKVDNDFHYFDNLGKQLPIAAKTAIGFSTSVDFGTEND